MIFKKPEDEIFNMNVDGKIIVWHLKVYKPVLWSTILRIISQNPQKLTAMSYNPDDGKSVYMKFRPKGKRKKIVEFQTEDECKQFYDLIASVIKGESKFNFEDEGYKFMEDER